MSEIKKGDPVKTFIIQVAALSWAATQVPEITVAIQSFLNARFRSAIQVEFVVMIEDEGLHPVTKASRVQSFRNLIPKHVFARYCWCNTEFFVERDHGVALQTGRSPAKKRDLRRRRYAGPVFGPGELG